MCGASAGHRKSNCDCRSGRCQADRSHLCMLHTFTPSKLRGLLACLGDLELGKKGPTCFASLLADAGADLFHQLLSKSRQKMPQAWLPFAMILLFAKANGPTAFEPIFQPGLSNWDCLQEWVPGRHWPFSCAWRRKWELGKLFEASWPSLPGQSHH